MRGDRVEVVVDTGGTVQTFEIVATRAGRRIEVTTAPLGPAFPGLPEWPGRRLRFARLASSPRSQWRDRAGFTPASRPRSES